MRNLANAIKGALTLATLSFGLPLVYCARSNQIEKEGIKVIRQVVDTPEERETLANLLHAYPSDQTEYLVNKVNRMYPELKQVDRNTKLDYFNSLRSLDLRTMTQEDYNILVEDGTL